MEKKLTITIIMILLFCIVVGGVLFLQNNATEPQSGGEDTGDVDDHYRTVMDLQVGQTTQFGGRDWLVLDVEGTHALLLHETVINNQPYHRTDNDATWETSSSRAWLNGEFLNQFSAMDRARIKETKVINDDNPWTFSKDTGNSNHTPGGENTTDKIFSLSIEEVTKYFGGSELLELGKNESNRNGSIDGLPGGDFYGQIRERNEVSESRKARNAVGEDSSWLLRSPGIVSHFAANVTEDGSLSVHGRNTVSFKHTQGLRPALWLDLES